MTIEANLTVNGEVMTNQQQLLLAKILPIEIPKICEKTIWDFWDFWDLLKSQYR